MAKGNKYIYIRAWGRLMHSFPYYIREQVEEAVRDNAPQNAIYCETNEDGTRRWHTYDDIESKSTLRVLDQIVESMEAGVRS